jgi:TonB family protein
VSLKYDDFDLQITPAGENKYRVHVNGPTGQASVDFVLPFTDVDVGNFLGRIGQVRRSVRRSDAPELRAAKDFGSKLFSAVFAGELIAQLRSSVEQSLNQDRGLRIRLRLTDAPALADLPWEFLYDAAQNHFLTTSTETPLVRFLDRPQRIAPLRATLPLRVLVVIASPRNLKRLDAEGEWERLQEALADLLRAGHIVLELLPSATLDALRVRARGAPFHIFHFIGHGGFDNVAQDGVLQFEDESGMSHPVRGELLGMQLHDHRSLRLAVLNACEGARSSRQDPFSGVAQSLLQQRVPAVIAMQFEISDAAAKVFAREFYCAIAEGNPVDAAVCESRKALFNEDFGQEWATPVLYMRSQEGLLFELQAPAAGVSDVGARAKERQRVEAESRAADLAAAERAAIAETERQAREKAERERFEYERKEAERRAAEKEKAEQTAAEERARQARETAERERLLREREVQANLTRKAAVAAVPAAAQPSTPNSAVGTIPTPVAAARPRIPLWQIALICIPVAGLILALSWHHLRGHAEDRKEVANSAPQTPPPRTENPASEASRTSEEAPVETKSYAAKPEPRTVVDTKAARRDDVPPPKAAVADVAAPNRESSESNPEPSPPAKKQPTPPVAAPSGRLRVEANAQEAKLVNHVSPVYPTLAAQGHLTGAVTLRVMIARDGSVQTVIVTSGNPVLAQSAIDAVKQWRYQPTLVNDKPVEVETIVTLDYTLKTKEAAAAAPQTAPVKQAPCTLGRVDFQEGGTTLVGTVPFTYTGNSQLQTLAVWGIPLTAEKKQIPGITLAQSTLQVPNGTASFSMESHPSLGHTGPVGEYVLVALAVKSTGEIVCNKLVPYHRTW